MARKILSDAFSVQFIMHGYATGRPAGNWKLDRGDHFTKEKKGKEERDHSFFADRDRTVPSNYVA